MKALSQILGLLFLLSLIGCVNLPTQETTSSNDLAETTQETTLVYQLDVTIEDTTLGTVSGNGSYLANEQVNIQIILSEDVIFDGWMIEGTLLSIDTNFYFTMPDYDVTITAGAHKTEIFSIKRLNMLLPPETYFYFPGVEFSIKGLVVEVEYDNGNKEIIDNDDLEIIIPQFDTEKTYSVTVNYEGFSTYFLVFYEDIRLEINTLKTLFVVGETVDYYYCVNTDLVGNGDDLYQIEVLNPEIAEAFIDPSYPQHAEITGLQAGSTQVKVTLVSNPAITQTVDINVVGELPPVESDTWPSEYLNLILNDLSLELTPLIGTSYTFEPSQIYNDYYRFFIDNPDETLDYVAYALNMETQGWHIVKYLPHSASFTKNNVYISISYNSVTNQANISIVKQGHDFLPIDITDNLQEIISGKIHESVSILPLPDYMFYDYTLSQYSWNHPFAEIIYLYGDYLNDSLLTEDSYSDTLISLGFTTLIANERTWYLDPNETYMLCFWIYDTHVQMEIQSIDYYNDPFHYLNDYDIYN